MQADVSSKSLHLSYFMFGKFSLYDGNFTLIYGKLVHIDGNFTPIFGKFAPILL